MSDSIKSTHSERLAALLDNLREQFPGCEVLEGLGEATLVVPAGQLLETATRLRDEAPYLFDELVDVCGVDYAGYGQSEWATGEASFSGYGRGVASQAPLEANDEARFAAVYHLLSVANNQRLRLRVPLGGDQPVVASVVGIWSSANWFEREAFDLFGILFDGHPDLRRILTDYGFVGHPFRKDFPLEGHVEMRYDMERQRVVYEPVTIEPRTLVPRVIREDNRYQGDPQETQDATDA